MGAHEKPGDLVQGTLDMLVLKTVVRGAMHGYAIAEFIQATSNNVLRVEEGALYPALHRLELRGLLASEWGVSDNNRRAKYYRLAVAGRRQLSAESEHWSRMTSAIALIMDTTFAALETLWQDLRYAARTLAKTPAFSTVAVLSLALGMGANTALFSLMDVMLLRALPVKNPKELVEFVRATPDGSMMTNLPYAVYEYFCRDHSALSDVFAISPSSPVLRTRGISERARAHEVSGSFFPALGVQALVGRIIGPDDDRAGAANRVAVISYAFWSRQFGRDPAALNADVRLSGERFTVVGIMPPEFFGVDRGSVPDLWVPLAADPNPAEPWVLGRLQPGVSVERARAQLEPVFPQALESLRDSFKLSPERERQAFLAQRLLVNRATEGTSAVRWTYWEYSSTLKILIGLTGLVLLIACANLANLLMARSAARSREIGIRLALGAGRWRLVRQLMTENLLLALAGGALGLLVAGWGHRLLLGFLARDPLGVALDFRLDHRLLGFGLALSVATGLLFGLMPAIRATRAEVYRPRGVSNLPLAKGL